MEELHYLLTDVFTNEPFTGNPLAIFMDCDGLAPQAMQTIARELNISECAFVFPPAGGDHHFQVSIYTPTMELPFAGHPTIGAALALHEARRLNLQPEEPLRFLMKAGVVEVAFEQKEGRLQAVLSAPQVPQRIGDLPPAAEIASMVGLTEADLDPVPPTAYSAGVPYTLLPVASREALRRARLDLRLWQELLSTSAAPHVYLFVLADDGLIEARMFAPAMGIAEDPATGAAVSALAGLLFDLNRPFDGRREWRIAQGLAIGRPSDIRLTVEAEGDRLLSVRVGGSAAAVGKGTIRAPHGR